MELSRRFSPWQLLLISLNGIIGSAWLFAPYYAAKIAGPAAIVAWMIGGGITLLIALTFTELSVLLPVAGGTAQIPQLSHGALVGFIVGWVGWLSAVIMAPIEVQAVLQYAATYYHSLTYVVNGVPLLTPYGLCWATVLMLVFCFINTASAQGLVRFNILVLIFKLTVIGLTIYILVTTQFYQDNFSSLEKPYTQLPWQQILSAVTSGGIVFAFTGFKHAVELAGEAKKLAYAIPLAVIGSVICCSLLYIGLQIAFVGALNNSVLFSGWQNISFGGDVGPFAGLAAGLGLVWLLKLLYADAIISPLGTGLIYVTSTSRILYAMSKMGYMPNFLSKLNQHNMPVAAITVNFLIGMILFLPLSGWQAMVNFLVSAMVISYAMGPVALLCLRAALPNETRYFRLPFAKFICFIAFYFCNLLSYWTGWETIYKLTIAVLVGLLFFTLAFLAGKVKTKQLGLRSIGFIVPYLAGLVMISYFGSFGGRNIITFGWDFMVIGIFSAIMLYLAVITRASDMIDWFTHHYAHAPSSSL